ncbi:squalene/phytoene synthase family protein [Streptomyces sp. NPDC007355]|uniref:squalene/phytoene synthase family protein n=1 Tax=Streptomyces sp. NPDC007355 TaxID=3364778 RepID=UPI0036BC5A78
MPTVLRPPCWALWAAASVLDDLADQRDVQQAEREVRVQAWTEALQYDLAAGTSTDPVRHALVDTALRWRLDLSSLQGAMTNTRDDVHGHVSPTGPRGGLGATGRSHPGSSRYGTCSNGPERR